MSEQSEGNYISEDAVGNASEIGQGVSISLSAASRINFASAQNDVPIIRSLSLYNNGDKTLTDLDVTLTADPPVIRPKTWKIDSLGANQSLSLSELSTPLDNKLLSGLNETEIGSLCVSVLSGTQYLLSETRQLELLARDQWGGLADMDRLLAAFVSPNDAAIATILKEASLLLERSGHTSSLEGYQSGDPQRAWMIAGAIWSAVTGMGLTYANPPASFEMDGQKVRSPERIRSEGLATCLDSALLLAAAWEQAGLNPVVLFSEGHAWAGVWITKRDFGQVTEMDVVAVRKASQAKEFIPVETTLLTRRPTIGFEQAVDAGRSQLAEEREHEFRMAVDITRARSARIRPLANHVSSDMGDAEHIEAAPAKLPSALDFGLLPSELLDPIPDTPKGRIERWQAKLLDLSLRNRLLNFKQTKQTVPCLVPDLAGLEDALAADEAFKAYPLLEEDPISERQLTPEDKERIIQSTVEDAFTRGQITVPLNKKDTENRLLTLYRKAKSDLQEGGTNTLFLAAGFLRWKRDGDKKSYRAPLLLVPIKLARKSARSDFKILHHEDEVRFNSTLLEFLKRDFDLSLSKLEGELPRDASGIDVPQVFDWMRSYVRDIAGFEVVEEISLSTFSFSKFLMWKDLVDRTDQLRNNRLVAHLVDNPDKTFESAVETPVAPHEIDKRVDPKDLLTPLPADSSQLAAVVAASEGQDFVLIGPPGTGKSQTIANIICQCIAHDKTVLFVAEKAAALDVVQRRLESHGLGDAVLELHSNKTDRKRVLSQLSRGWDRASTATQEGWIDITDKLQIKRDQLNTYVAEIHAKGTQGFSVYEAISWIASEPRGLSLSFDHKDIHDQQSFDALLDMADELERTYQAVADGPALSLIVQAEWSYAWEQQILDHAKALRQSLDQASRTAIAVGNLLTLDAGKAVTQKRLLNLADIAQRANQGATDLRLVPQLSEGDLLTEMDRFRAAHKALDQAKSEMKASYGDDNLSQVPYDQLDADWRAGEASIWPFSSLKKRKVRKLLQTYASSGQADPGTDLGAIKTARKHLKALHENPIARVAGESRSVDQADAAVAQAITLRRAISELRADVSDTPIFQGAALQLEGGLASGDLQRSLKEWQSHYADLQKAVSDFQTCGGHVPPNMPLDTLQSVVEETLTQRARLADWVRWKDVKSRADIKGLSALTDALESGDLKEGTQAACRRAYARWWLPLAIDASEPLRRFAYWEHEDIIDAFQELDNKVAELAPIEVMRRTQHRLPARDGVPRKSELGVLRHQARLQRPSLAIRSLLEQLGETLPKLAPCVLMSPLSIAQYLPAGQSTFDVVIFDEASQITTWDAVGAIARGKQSIIVGDPKQLPPTNFFGRSDDEEESDDATGMLGDMPSILDEVATAGIPTRRLNWHYRSRDEALIAFSNHFYYDGGLVTFPAPTTNSDAVQLHKIDGTYARGAGRTNFEEAKAIVSLIRKRLTAWVKLPIEDRPTLGVITFNVQQQGLILDLLDQMRRSHSQLEWFFADDREEPVIVKNLENIQGDERDVMLFSITFAADTAGRLTMNFGALNSDGGEKRLNVAVTRARSELHVFASINHDQIDLSKTRARGVRDLKTFLDYAERGSAALAARNEGSLGPAENIFEEAIAAAFNAKGWEVRTQIGVSGFRIDLGVVNPDRAGAFLAGIECDGATYHSSATARDRDKVRQSVLENLGWNILRIWSTDWFRSPSTVVERVHKDLERLLEEDRASRAAADLAAASEPMDPPHGALETPALDDQQIDAPPPQDFPEQTEEHERSTVYANAPQSSDPIENTSIAPAVPAADPERFYDLSYVEDLRKIIQDILEKEGPLPLRNLGKSVANRHGWQRTGRRIMDRVKRTMADVDLRDEFGVSFVWVAGTVQSRYPFRGLSDRSIQDVSRTEIASVLDDIGSDLSISEDPIGDLARHLGITRVSSSTRKHLMMVRDWHHQDAKTL